MKENLKITAGKTDDMNQSSVGWCSEMCEIHRKGHIPMHKVVWKDFKEMGACLLSLGGSLDWKDITGESSCRQAGMGKSGLGQGKGEVWLPATG